MNSSKLDLGTPWATFQKQLQVLFGQDPDITVGELYTNKCHKTDYTIDIVIRNSFKLAAAMKLLPRIKNFGTLTVALNVMSPITKDSEEPDLSVCDYEALFSGNPVYHSIRVVGTPSGEPVGYVRFAPQVLQFPADDLSDYNGNWSGLAKDIACELFGDSDFHGHYFCTAPIGEEADPPINQDEPTQYSCDNNVEFVDELNS